MSIWYKANNTNSDFDSILLGPCDPFYHWVLYGTKFRNRCCKNGDYVVASSECLVVLWHHLWQLGNFLNEFTRIQWKRFTKHHGNTKQNFMLFIIYLTGTSKYFCFFLEPLKVSSHKVLLITIRTLLEANGWKKRKDKTTIMDEKDTQRS